MLAGEAPSAAQASASTAPVGIGDCSPAAVARVGLMLEPELRGAAGVGEGEGVELLSSMVSFSMTRLMREASEASTMPMVLGS